MIGVRGSIAFHRWEDGAFVQELTSKIQKVSTGVIVVTLSP